MDNRNINDSWLSSFACEKKCQTAHLVASSENLVVIDGDTHLVHTRKTSLLSASLAVPMKKVNKQCLLDTPRTVRVSEKTWQVIVRTKRP